MRLSKKGNSIFYNYRGDLQKEVDKSFSELEKKESQVLLIDAIYEKAKKEHSALHKRIEDLKSFLDFVEKDKGIVPKKKG